MSSDSKEWSEGWGRIPVSMTPKEITTIMPISLKLGTSNLPKYIHALIGTKENYRVSNPVG
jgi:hypothetical protein